MAEREKRDDDLVAVRRSDLEQALEYADEYMAGGRCTPLERLHTAAEGPALRRADVTEFRKGFCAGQRDVLLSMKELVEGYGHDL